MIFPHIIYRHQFLLWTIKIFVCYFENEIVGVIYKFGQYIYVNYDIISCFLGLRWAVNLLLVVLHNVIRKKFSFWSTSSFCLSTCGPHGVVRLEVNSALFTIYTTYIITITFQYICVHELPFLVNFFTPTHVYNTFIPQQTKLVFATKLECNKQLNNIWRYAEQPT